MKGLITTFIIMGVVVMIVLVLTNELSPASMDLMKNTVISQPIIP